MKVQEASSKSNACTLVQELSGMYFARTVASSLVPLLLNVIQRVERAGKWRLGYLMFIIHKCYPIAIVIILSIVHL